MLIWIYQNGVKHYTKYTVTIWGGQRKAGIEQLGFVDSLGSQIVFK